MLLNEYNLSIPAISADDWQKAIDSSSGLMRDILVAQAAGASLLKTVEESKASTERIGWLNLWAKTFAASEAAAAAITHRSRLVLLLCQRNTFELMLQMHTIMDPIRNLGNSGAGGEKPRGNEEYALRSSIDRLRAYAAWCLWHDKAYYKEVLNPKSMRDIWSVEQYDPIENPGGKTGSAFEHFLEKNSDTLSEATLREVGRNVRRLYTDKIKQIDEWMADPRLRKWSDTIEQASKNNIVGVPFFVLFDRSDASIPKRLLKEGMRFSYSAYILSSIASHGSSMEEFVQIEDRTIKPSLTGDQEQINILAPEVIFRCRHIFSLLESINIEMLKKPQLRS